MDDWNTLSLKPCDSQIGSTRISQRSMKEIGLETAIELADEDILCDAASTKDGLVSMELRAKAWPLLLGIDKNDSGYLSGDNESLEKHHDETQIELDVNRAFVHYPNAVSSDEKTILRSHLRQLLVRFFRNYPELSYYQGLHDIGSVFLLVIKDPELSYRMFEEFSLLHLRDFMLPSIDSSIDTLKIIPELLLRMDKNLYHILGMNEAAANPFFCLSPIITLFSHDLKTLQSLCLVFDQILAYRSIDVIFFMYSHLLVNKQEAILQELEAIGQEDDSFDRKDLIHNILSKYLSKVNIGDINEVIVDLPNLLKQYKLSSLRSFKQLNKYSVLKASTLSGRSFRALIQVQIEESEKSKRQLQSLKLRDIIPKLTSRKKHQLLKITLTIGVVSIMLNMLLQRKDNTRVNTYITYGRTYLSAGLQPLREYWRHYSSAQY